VLKKSVLLAGAAALAAVSAAEARDQIRIVGSSTVYPFAQVVAERFGKSGKFRTPILESTGSGGGLKLFCAGTGVNTPDITNASRRIKKSEFQRCRKNGVTQITEFKIGYDGIVIGRKKGAGVLALSRKILFLALAKRVPMGNKAGGKLVANPNRTWKDVDAKLPAIKIRVLGPPPTSGTRDAFNELAIEGGCKTFPELKAMKKKAGKKAYRGVCRAIREDGVYVEEGENDNVIVQKLTADANTLGVFGFSFLDQNRDKLEGMTVGGIAPKFELIASQKYPISRSLFFYVKKAHIGAIKGIHEYVKSFMATRAIGNDGFLVDKGLIPLPPADMKKYQKAAQMLPDLSM
jgi:phosphate transport system substrate-binding protein